MKKSGEILYEKIVKISVLKNSWNWNAQIFSNKNVSQKLSKNSSNQRIQFNTFISRDFCSLVSFWKFLTIPIKNSSNWKNQFNTLFSRDFLVNYWMLLWKSEPLEKFVKSKESIQCFHFTRFSAMFVLQSSENWHFLHLFLENKVTKRNLLPTTPFRTRYTL